MINRYIDIVSIFMEIQNKISFEDAIVKRRSVRKFEPGKKPMSTMAPVIVFDKNKDLMLITGSP